jgi:preprotein translocase subunit YajC
MDPGPLIFLAALAAVFWFVLIRPQRRRQQEHRALVLGLSQDDEVITAGGIFGTIRSVADDHVVLEVAPGTEIRVAKEAVATVVRKDDESAATADQQG